jgi:hypothetical protein
MKGKAKQWKEEIGEALGFRRNVLERPRDTTVEWIRDSDERITGYTDLDPDFYEDPEVLNDITIEEKDPDLSDNRWYLIVDDKYRMAQHLPNKFGGKYSRPPLFYDDYAGKTEWLDGKIRE